jgi:hypothetical protein
MRLNTLSCDTLDNPVGLHLIDQLNGLYHSHRRFAWNREARPPAIPIGIVPPASRLTM